MPRNVCWHAAAARWTRRELAETRAEISRQEARSALGRAMRDWPSATSYVQRVFPGTRAWLLSCSSGEGGWGRWFPNSQGSGAGGWMQYMSGTFYGYVHPAVAAARSRGLTVPAAAISWYSTLGQAVTAAYMRSIGISHYHWDPRIDSRCW